MRGLLLRCVGKDFGSAQSRGKGVGKGILRERGGKSFLSQTPHFYLEENNLHGCLLCNIKDLDAAIAMTEEFLPFIDNWATNDITATGMKIFRGTRRR